MLHSVNSIRGCTLSLVLALFLFLSFLLNNGCSEASVYHMKGKRYCFPVVLLFKLYVCVHVSPVLGLVPWSINRHLCCDLWPLNQPQLADCRLCPPYPDLAFNPPGLFTAYQCVPIDCFLKVTGMPLWIVLTARGNGRLPDLLQKGFMNCFVESVLMQLPVKICIFLFFQVMKTKAIIWTHSSHSLHRYLFT